VACRIGFRFSHSISSQRTVLVQLLAYILTSFGIAILACVCLKRKPILQATVWPTAFRLHPTSLNPASIMSWIWACRHFARLGAIDRVQSSTLLYSKGIAVSETVNEATPRDANQETPRTFYVVGITVLLPT
jgi:hypothetical protein